MLRFLLRRGLLALATGVGIAVLGYLMLHARPDEALRIQADRQGLEGEAARRALSASLGFDRPLPLRLAGWAADLVRGDLGPAWSRPGASVREVLRQHLPPTLALTGTALLLQLALGVGLAAVSLARRGSWKDTLLNAVALGFHALPEFCLGLLLLWPFAVRLGWFPLSGAASLPWERAAAWGWLDRLHHVALPALTLGLGGAATVARLVRVRWEEELGSAYVTAARARGIGARRVLWRHSLRGAAGPLCTAVGLSLPALIGGAVVVETVFAWPGLGRVLVEAVAARDLPLLAGVNLLFAVLVAVGGLLSDVLWGLADPRVRH